jgi:hypothetical protein
MAFASLVSTVAFFGLLGPWAQAFSAFIALALAFVASPIIAFATKGRYYLARSPYDDSQIKQETMICVSCGFDYEKKDMTSCPFHVGTICSLCCSLEASCEDMCKAAPASIPAVAPAE